MGLIRPRNLINAYYRKLGEILHLSKSVETTLDFFLANYYKFPPSYETIIKQDEFIEDNFYKKIRELKRIFLDSDTLIKYNLTKEKANLLIKDLNKVREIRNKIAHYQSYKSDPKTDIIVLISGKSIRKKEDDILIDNNLVRELRKTVKTTKDILNRLYISQYKKDRRV